MKKKKAAEAAVRHQSWLTTDEYEIELRKKRAEKEIFKIEPVVKRGKNIFRNYRVCGGSAEYRIELRSLNKNINTCSCPDFIKNFLGTCKHIEKLKMQLGKAKGDSPLAEIYLDHVEWHPVLQLPRQRIPAVLEFLGKYFNEAGNCCEPRTLALSAFLRELESAPVEISSQIRVSAEILVYNQKLTDLDRLEKMRQTYERQVQANHGQLPFLRYALYDYQVAGMLHLAFKGRAILADEMGLGKTVQAVAAAAIMHECLGVKRVLVVAPASLKTEWEEQIRKFTELNSEAVFGGRAERLRLYRHSKVFFLLTNYEQVVRDREDIVQLFQPDLIILDEAQRIKNWKTKTAQTLKRMDSPYVFVLTGTPLENRIDDIYSLTEMIDPTIFGSLFRFNRRFLDFDANGKTCGMKNLRELHEKLRPIMLRRRKDDIQEDLPERIDNNYFVEMTKEQKKRYADHEDIVSRLCAASQKRPLTDQEFDRLQLNLAAMRMFCDSCYIMDQAIAESPKIDELKRILEDFQQNAPERKIIIFSEWVRMLDLAALELDKMELGYVMHTGRVPQQKRREEINRFKNDPDCRVFLSSDSGGVGLNLQAASIVINLDLPWNPAKLEQRIARAWRKMQKNSVNVINLVALDSIEHKMLGTLQFKQRLSDFVLDARGEAEDFEQANAKSAFITRLNELMDARVSISAPPANPDTVLQQELTLNNPGIGKLLALQPPEKPPVFLGIGEAVAAAPLREQIRRSHGETVTDRQITVITPEIRDLLQKLAEQGFISINNTAQAVFSNAQAEPPNPSDRKRRLELCLPILESSRRSLKMAKVLKAGDFDEEAILPAWKAVHEAALALYAFVPTDVLEKLPGQISTKMAKELVQLNHSQRNFLLLCQNKLNQDDPFLFEEAAKFQETVEAFISSEQMKP
jgi:superfamily II DNA or RNA helicase/predicted nucleic acid-binding Zn finger protein